MTKVYEHKYDSKRKIVAAKLTESNVNEIADWTGGQVVEERDALDSEKTFVGVNVPTGSQNDRTRASEGDYVLIDADGVFHVRKPGVFESKYKLSEVQDVAFDFEEDETDTGADVGQEDEHGLRTDESAWAEDHDETPEAKHKLDDDSAFDQSRTAKQI